MEVELYENETLPVKVASTASAGQQELTASASH
jgi:hypothetical protein